MKYIFKLIKKFFKTSRNTKLDIAIREAQWQNYKYVVEFYFHNYNGYIIDKVFIPTNDYKKGTVFWEASKVCSKLGLAVYDKYENLINIIAAPIEAEKHKFENPKHHITVWTTVGSKGKIPCMIFCSCGECFYLSGDLKEMNFSKENFIRYSGGR